MSIVVHGPSPGTGEEDFPSHEDLADVLERVHEEIRVAQLLAHQVELRDALAPHMVSALRESLLVRIFRLRHFFYGRAAEGWELVASDYFPRPADWTAIRPTAPPHLSRWLDDLLVWVVDRVYVDPEGRVPEEAWPLASLVEALVETHKLFCEAIVEHHEQSFVDFPWPQTPEGDIVSDLSEGGPSDQSERESSGARSKPN